MSTTENITPVDPGDRAAQVEELAIKIYYAVDANIRRTLGKTRVGRVTVHLMKHKMTWEKASNEVRNNYRGYAELAIEHVLGHA